MYSLVACICGAYIYICILYRYIGTSVYLTFNIFWVYVYKERVYIYIYLCIDIDIRLYRRNFSHRPGQFVVTIAFSERDMAA